ncbi:MAG: hypothetical protein JWN73_722 [Betaproteobacteria bacterium]|nr:hypothetical protein [Betaproteobacteria bacterium]
MINKTLMSLAVAGALFTAAPAFAMTKSEYKAEQDRISTTYKAARERCGGLAGNAKDVCIEEARGNEKVANADLDGRYQPSNKANYDSRVARADAQFAVAKEKCDDYAGNAKDVCRRDAESAHDRSLADAKADRAAADAQGSANTKIADARAEADRDKRDADYKAARERCDTYAGDAKDRCVGDAKSRFGIK